MKILEGRIIIYLSQVEYQKKKATAIAARFDKNYNYINQTINIMKEKGWLTVITVGRENFYEISKLELVEEAKNLIAEWGGVKEPEEDNPNEDQ